MRGLKIGSLAGLTGCPAETIRYYEKIKLLPEPPRSEAQYRLYNDYHVRRLKFIRHCRMLDMSLDEIRELLHLWDEDQENCAGAALIIDKHIGHVALRLAQLTELQQKLEELRNKCGSNNFVADCGILKELTCLPQKEPQAQDPGTHTTNIHG